mmetsp:Transcript_27643/g.72874  ORF Transcript_27643/g.72874 Transcript_27643/m.72874 type:complete len:96 (+) Transcript_27643:2328-2615(+)
MPVSYCRRSLCRQKMSASTSSCSEVDATACFFGVNGVPLWLIQVLRRAANLDAASHLDDHAACSERSHVYGVLGGRCSVRISSLHLLALPPFIFA